MTGLEKIAILFRVLGTEFALPMTEMMRREEITLVAEAMMRFEVDRPSDEDVKAVLEEYRTMMSAGGIFANANETLQTIFTKKFGAEQGALMLQEARVCAKVESPFEALMRVGFEDLRRLLSEEHPQVQAAVLANIDAELAAGVLDAMPEGERRAILERIATMRPPTARLLQDIAELFIDKTMKLPRAAAVTRDGPSPSVKRAADILNAASPSTKTILDELQKESPELVEMIRDSMFTFADLAQIDKMTMQKILGGIDAKVLALALKACPEEVSNAIFAAVSARTKDMIIEEKDLLGAVPLTDVRDAQKEIVGTIRGMMESGTINVSIGGGGVSLVE